MTTIDFLVVIAYFVGVAGIGYWSSRRSLADSKSYFLGGRNIGWFAIGASLFASNISTEHFVGLAGGGAAGGLAVSQFDNLSCFWVLLLGWLFVPFYLRMGIFTLPEFLERRYNAHCRTYLSSISLIAYIFTKISVALYAGAMVLNIVLGWDIWTSAIILIIATGIYTIFGGLRAVIYTDLFQTFVLIAGGTILTIIGISKVGGLEALTQKIDPSFFSVWKGVNHPDFPWTGILFGAPILGVWYWCTDQMIVQRTLAATNLKVARRATVFAGALKILPIFILVLPGIAGRILFPEVASNKMYAQMVNELLPVGIKGLMIAALMAALMSSLSSVFNSSSTLVVMDFYKKYKPGAGEKELVFAGQIATALLVVIGLAWLPFIGILSDQLFVYLQSVQAYISPPIAVVFLLGVSCKRLNGQGALAALLGGGVIGILRFIIEIGVKTDLITAGPLVWFASINFLHFAIILAVFCTVIMVLVSLATAPPDQEKLSMFVTEGREDTTEDSKSRKTNIFWTVMVVLAILAIWVYFSPWVFK